MNNPNLSIVVPCYNERDNLPSLIDRFSKFWPENKFELIMVDNGSTDGTGEVLAAAVADERYHFTRIVTIGKNVGYGHGILTGLKAANAPVLAYTHADLQTPPEDVFRAYSLLLERAGNANATLIKGQRVNRPKEALFLTRMMTRIVEAVLGYHMEDINGQPKLFPRELLDKLTHPPLDFAFDIYAMYVARLNGWELVEFPVDFGQRVHGESKWASTALTKYKTTSRYLLSILRIAIAHRSAPGNLIRQMVRFGLTGVLTNTSNYSVFFALLKLASTPYIISSAVGFMVGFLIGFFVNRAWTFGATEGKTPYQMGRFYIVNMISLGANLGTITFFTEIAGLIPEISQVLAIAVSTAVNFTGSKFWAFSH